MTLRKFLLIPLVVSLTFFVYFSEGVRQSFTILLQNIDVTKGLVITIVIAVILQMLGHIIRAYKARLVFGVAKESSVRFQFRSLSIGYLFDTILPFRLGELIRARVISGAMTISFGYAIVLIIFERLVDAAILGCFGLVLLMLEPTLSSHVVWYIVALLTIAIAGLVTIYVVAKQNKTLLRTWYHITRLGNNEVKTAGRFKAWTIIYGLGRTMHRKLMISYLALSIASWLFYGASLLVLAIHFLHGVSFTSHLVAAVAPYYGVGVPAGPASLGVFSKISDTFTAPLHINTNIGIAYDLAAWSVLIIPIALVGLVLLYTKTKEALWYDRPHKASQNSLVNKLHRVEDISGEMEVFLENYFSGNSLSRIVHDLEAHGEFKLVKYFKGGSDAITILVLQRGEQVVKKIIPYEFEDRLKAQYDWLKAHEGEQGIVKAIGEHRGKNYYSIDLAFDASHEMFYEFIHKHTLEQSKRVLDEVCQVLADGVHHELKQARTYEAKRTAYVKKHIYGCLEKAAAVEPELVRAAKPKKLIINGVKYDNLYQVMDKIRANKQAWRDIATYRHSGAVHGDVIVDNILVSKKTGKTLVIDPAPDGNIFDGPVFDFGKLMQSLYCGYETLLRDEEAIFLLDGNKIDYQDHRSNKYTQLANYVHDELAMKHLTENVRRALLFHAATLYIRRLKHQVYYTPANVLKFYAVGVKTLNDFLAQYD